MQIGQGGYYGTDLSDLAKGMIVTYRAVRMRIRKRIKEKISFLRENILLLNKVGKLLREEPTLGRAIAM